MAALAHEIIVKADLRPCLCYGMRGLFHRWTNDGKAIIEFEDGSCSEVCADNIQFCDDVFKNYAFGGDEIDT